MKLRNILAATALYALVFGWAHADDGLRMLPRALLQQANPWSARQFFNGGLDVQGSIGNQQGDGTDGCHFTYTSGAGNLMCVQAGIAWRPLYVDASALYFGNQIPTMRMDFLGTGGFNVLGSPITMAKLGSAPGAPGAGKSTLFVLAGTNAGTCKLQVVAGTSATPVTVADNVGAGC